MIVEGGKPEESSLKTFKSSVKDVRLDTTTVDPTEVESLLAKNIEMTRSMRSQLERSASSIRHERRDIRKMLEYEVGKQAIDEGWIWIVEWIEEKQNEDTIKEDVTGEEDEEMKRHIASLPNDQLPIYSYEVLIVVLSS